MATINHEWKFQVQQPGHDAHVAVNCPQSTFEVTLIVPVNIHPYPIFLTRICQYARILRPMHSLQYATRGPAAKCVICPYVLVGGLIYMKIIGNIYTLTFTVSSCELFVQLYKDLNAYQVQIMMFLTQA
jgi:hypothetical protein